MTDGAGHLLLPDVEAHLLLYNQLAERVREVDCGACEGGYSGEAVEGVVVRPHAPQVDHPVLE